MLRSYVDRARSDRVVRDSSLMMGTKLLMAGTGSLFWAVAARTNDRVDVGLAGSVIAATVTISYLALLGLQHTMIKMLPHSRTPRRLTWQVTGLVTLAGALLGLGYLVALRFAAPSIYAIFESPYEGAVFVVVAAASGVNLLSDGILLAVGALGRNLVINGVLMGVIKCGLPFLLTSLGAFGLVTSVGLASVVAAVLSMVVAFSRLAPDQEVRGSGLRSALAFTGAGYAASVINMIPILVMPMLVVELLSAAENAVYFIAFQIVSLLNAVAYSINASSFAHASRAPEEGRQVVRSALRMSVGGIALGGLVLAVLAPWLLLVFGSEYRDEGTWALRLMALASVPLALENWYAVRLRLRNLLRSMVVQQVVVTVTMLVSAYLLLPLGLEWAAAPIALAYAAGSAYGFFATRGGSDEVVGLGPDEEPAVRAETPSEMPRT